MQFAPLPSHMNKFYEVEIEAKPSYEYYSQFDHNFYVYSLVNCYIKLGDDHIYLNRHKLDLEALWSTRPEFSSTSQISIVEQYVPYATTFSHVFEFLFMYAWHNNLYDLIRVTAHCVSDLQYVFYTMTEGRQPAMFSESKLSSFNILFEAGLDKQFIFDLILQDEHYEVFRNVGHAKMIKYLVKSNCGISIDDNPTWDEFLLRSRNDTILKRYVLPRWRELITPKFLKHLVACEKTCVYKKMVKRGLDVREFDDVVFLTSLEYDKHLFLKFLYPHYQDWLRENGETVLRQKFKTFLKKSCDMLIPLAKYGILNGCPYILDEFIHKVSAKLEKREGLCNKSDIQFLILATRFRNMLSMLRDLNGDYSKCRSEWDRIDKFVLDTRYLADTQFVSPRQFRNLSYSEKNRIIIDNIEIPWVGFSVYYGKGYREKMINIASDTLCTTQRIKEQLLIYALDMVDPELVRALISCGAGIVCSDEPYYAYQNDILDILDKIPICYDTDIKKMMEIIDAFLDIGDRDDNLTKAFDFSVRNEFLHLTMLLLEKYYYAFPVENVRSILLSSIDYFPLIKFIITRLMIDDPGLSITEIITEDFIDHMLPYGHYPELYEFLFEQGLDPRCYDDYIWKSACTKRILSVIDFMFPYYEANIEHNDNEAIIRLVTGKYECKDWERGSIVILDKFFRAGAASDKDCMLLVARHLYDTSTCIITKMDRYSLMMNDLINTYAINIIGPNWLDML